MKSGLEKMAEKQNLHTIINLSTKHISTLLSFQLLIVIIKIIEEVRKFCEEWNRKDGGKTKFVYNYYFKYKTHFHVFIVSIVNRNNR